MRYAQGNAAKMVVHSPMEGVVVYNTIWLGGRMGTVQQGDQVRPACLSPGGRSLPNGGSCRAESGGCSESTSRPTRADALRCLSRNDSARSSRRILALGHTGQFTKPSGHSPRAFPFREPTRGSCPTFLPPSISISAPRTMFSWFLGRASASRPITPSFG